MMLHRTKEKYTIALSRRLLKEDPNYDRWTFFFFELDEPFNVVHYYKICELYRLFGLDFLVHRSGNGLHFISPTLIELITWKEMMSHVKDINPRCPQNALRWKNNKYVEEKEIWFSSSVGYCNDGSRPNSYELVNLLNKFFRCEFEGNYPTQLKLSRYKQNYETQ